jgi:hypothetical protein
VQEECNSMAQFVQQESERCEQIKENIRRECKDLLQQQQRTPKATKASTADGLSGQHHIYPEMLDPDTTYELVKSIAARSQTEDDFRIIFQSAKREAEAEAEAAAAAIAAAVMESKDFNSLSTSLDSESVDDVRRKKGVRRSNISVSISLSELRSSADWTKHVTITDEQRRIMEDEAMSASKLLGINDTLLSTVHDTRSNWPGMNDSVNFSGSMNNWENADSVLLDDRE